MMIQHLGEKSALRPRVGEKTNFPKSSGELQTKSLLMPHFITVFSK